MRQFGNEVVDRFTFAKMKVVKDKLFELVDRIREGIGTVNGRCFVDSAPVLERDWAKRSGLGWIGKHTLLLSKQKGSYFFLAELILNWAKKMQCIEY